MNDRKEKKKTWNKTEFNTVPLFKSSHWQSVLRPRWKALAVWFVHYDLCPRNVPRLNAKMPHFQSFLEQSIRLDSCNGKHFFFSILHPIGMKCIRKKNSRISTQFIYSRISTQIHIYLSSNSAFSNFRVGSLLSADGPSWASNLSIDQGISVSAETRIIIGLNIITVGIYPDVREIFWINYHL